MRYVNPSQNDRFLVGILTTEGKHSALTGNFKLFRDLSNKLAKKGVKMIVITPHHLKEHAIQGGYVFNEKKNSWMATKYSGVPNVIYNRVPYRKDENKKEFSDFLTWCNLHSVPMFNQSFFNKWDIYQALMKNKNIYSHHLPFTQLLQTKEQLEQLLHDYSSLYLKPNDGSKGNGIFMISKYEDGTYHIKGHNQMYGSSFLQNVWEKKINPLLVKREYIVQEKVSLAKQNDRTYDFRIFAHNVNNDWKPSGIGIRQSKVNGITTHVLKGGNIVQLHDIATREDIDKLNELTISCGNTLELAFGFGSMKEFSIDIGKTEDHRFYIFDINSKPMKFDEDDIYEAGLNHLVEIFLEYKKEK